MKLDAACYYETSITCYQTVRSYISGDCNLRIKPHDCVK